MRGQHDRVAVLPDYRGDRRAGLFRLLLTGPGRLHRNRPFRGGLPVPGEVGHERTCGAPDCSRAARATTEFESKYYDTEREEGPGRLNRVDLIATANNFFAVGLSSRPKSPLLNLLKTEPAED